MPAISVVMPVYNTKEYVGKAIQSILDQTFSDFEFLIIDNGSTDGSGDVIARYAQADSRIRVIHNEKNVFIAEARNRALELVQGEYLNLIGFYQICWRPCTAEQKNTMRSMWLRATLWIIM